MKKIELDNMSYNDLVRAIKYAKEQKRKQFLKEGIPKTQEEYMYSINTLDLLLYNIGYREEKNKII